MAYKKISELSGITNPNLTGITVVVDNETTYKTTLNDLRNVLVDSGSHYFTGSQVINGNLTISGSITAQQYILSSSITNITTETISGSSNFGNSLDDIHIFTGSLKVTGSITSSYFTGDGSQLTNLPISHLATTSSLNLVSNNVNTLISQTSSYLTSLPSDLISGSSQISNLGFITSSQTIDTDLFAITGSNTFIGNQTITGSLSVSGSINITGNISGGLSMINFVPESSGEVGSNLSTIQLVPDINSPSSEQILIIDPTGGYPNHIHLRPGGPMDNSSTSIILGGESSNVSVIGGSNPPVQITSNNYLWQFHTDGTLGFPDGTFQNTAFTTSYIDDLATTGSNTFTGDETISGSLNVSGSATLNNSNIVSSDTILKIETITSSSYTSITPVSGTLYIIID